MLILIELIPRHRKLGAHRSSRLT